MSDLPLLAEYHIRHFIHRGVHTTGKLITFARPCIGYLLQGSAEILLNGQTYTAGVGDLIYIAAETEYYSVWSGDPQVDWYSVDFAFTDPLAFSQFRFQILRGYPGERLRLMFETYETDPMRSISELYALLSHLYGHRMEQSDYVPKYSRIHPAVEYLKAHCTEPVRIADLAAIAKRIFTRCSKA